MLISLAKMGKSVIFELSSKVARLLYGKAQVQGPDCDFGVLE
jgi:hypothetical protein